MSRVALGDKIRISCQIRLAESFGPHCDRVIELIIWIMRKLFKIMRFFKFANFQVRNVGVHLGGLP